MPSTRRSSPGRSNTSTAKIRQMFTRSHTVPSVASYIYYCSGCHSLLCCNKCEQICGKEHDGAGWHSNALRSYAIASTGQELNISVRYLSDVDLSNRRSAIVNGTKFVPLGDWSKTLLVAHLMTRTVHAPSQTEHKTPYPTRLLKLPEV